MTDDEKQKRLDYLTQPLSTYDWEGMHIEAEFPSAGLVTVSHKGNEDGSPEVEAKLQANHVLRLSTEIRRLRHKCGEDVWTCVSQTKEDIEKEVCKNN